MEFGPELQLRNDKRSQVSGNLALVQNGNNGINNF